jgi:hypothetical protein
MSRTDPANSAGLFDIVKTKGRCVMEKRRTPEKALVRLQALDEARARWWRRVVRAVNAIDKIDGQRKRLLKPKPLDRLDPPVPAEKSNGKTDISWNEMVGDDLRGSMLDRTAELPDYQRKLAEAAEKKAAAEAKDKAAMADIRASQLARVRIKAKASAAKSKAKAKGELRRMPLQGKDALRAIRGE